MGLAQIIPILLAGDHIDSCTLLDMAVGIRILESASTEVLLVGDKIDFDISVDHYGVRRFLAESVLTPVTPTAECHGQVGVYFPLPILRDHRQFDDAIYLLSFP